MTTIPALPLSAGRPPAEIVEFPAHDEEHRHTSIRLRADGHGRLPAEIAAGQPRPIDETEHGRDRVTGTFVLSPGDVRGTRFVHERVLIGCWSLVGWLPWPGESICVASSDCRPVRHHKIYTIFEGTSEIQRLVIARAISGRYIR